MQLSQDTTRSRAPCSSRAVPDVDMQGSDFGAVVTSNRLGSPMGSAMATIESSTARVRSAPSSLPSLARGAGRATPWLGVLALTGLAVWLGLIGFRALVDAHDLSSALDSARGVSVGPIVLVVIGVLLLAELRWPAVRRPLFARAHVVDAGYLALFAFIVLPVLTVVETGFSGEIEQHARFLILSRLPIAPQVAVVSATLVGIDLMNWAAHVANHRYLTLWRLHAVHHSQEDMGTLTTFRVHPLVHASYLPAIVPVLVLGASGTLPGAALIGYGCYVVLAHANLRFTFGPLGRGLGRPAYHQIHHAR